MNSPEYAALHIIHILALLGLVGAIFYGCAAAPEQRQRTLIWSGIASVLAVATGARMSQGIYHGMPGWVWVKLVCWLGLAALVGFAYRRRDRAKMWIAATLGLAAVALVMVYLKPF